MKKRYFTFILLLLLSVSCYDDNFVELSLYKDYMMECTIYLDPAYPNEAYEFEIIDYKTDGFEQLVSYTAKFEGVSSEFEMNYFAAVKGYKTVGVKIISVKNVIGYRFKLKEISAGYGDDNFSLLDISKDISTETTILYNFETATVSIDEN